MLSIHKPFLLFVAILSFTAGNALAVEPIKVFLLAGQSNMVGHGRFLIGHDGVDGAIGSLEYFVRNDLDNYGHLLDPNTDDWKVRDDVWYQSVTTAGNEIGNLTVGFGASTINIGPEFGFGHVVGDFLDEQVLLVKTAWGGRSLAVDFRPPSAAAKRGGTVGDYYELMLEEYENIISNIESSFPESQGRSVELVGFAWHQGYNDRFNGYHTEYEDNLADFIRDVRNDLGKPNLPFVVTETGNGSNSAALAVMDAQAAVADPMKYPEFEGNVAFVGTRDFWRGVDVSPTSAGHHWNANGESYYLMGEAMGQAMVLMIPEPSSVLLAITAIAGLVVARARRRA